MAVKEVIDIEALLHWAYGVQRVDQHSAEFSAKGPSASLSGNLAMVAQLGVRVDGGSFAAKAIGFRMPDDAMLVDATLWGLGDIWLEWLADGVMVWDRESASASGCSIIKMTPRGRVMSGNHAFADANGDWFLFDGADHRRLEAVGVQALVIIHARAGTRPEPLEARKRGRGRPARADYDGVEVEHARAVYLAWRAALVRIAQALKGGLQNYEVTGPMAPEKVW